MEKIKVLWVSRHEPLPCQKQFLEERLGKPVEFIVHAGHVPNAEYVASIAEKLGVQYVLPVLPLSFIARLVELAAQKGFTVLWSKMEPIATTASSEAAQKIVEQNPDCRTAVTYSDGTTRVYEFRTIEKIKAVKVETEPL